METTTAKFKLFSRFKVCVVVHFIKFAFVHDTIVNYSKNIRHSRESGSLALKNAFLQIFQFPEIILG